MNSSRLYEPQGFQSTHLTTSAPSPGGSLRGLLSRTLTRGRSTDQIPRRKHKSRAPSPNSNNEPVAPPNKVLPRSRSISWSGQNPSKLSKDGKCRSTRTSSAKNPPPFAEALRHAILHAKLDTPEITNTVKKDKSAANSPAVEVDVQVSPLVHRRRMSRSNSEGYNLVSKVFVLTDDGCILQYRSDGASNRAPERILELGPQSIAVASDAIPGKHWVLSAVCDGRRETPQANLTLRPSRSRLFLRHAPEVKRHVRDLLLVFANDSIFNQWLICVRKEIEALGGLEYRPDSRGANSLLQMGQTADKHNLVLECSFAYTNRHASRLSKAGHDHEAESMTHRNSIVSPHSTTGSSVGSNTELDRLRASIVDARSLGSGTASIHADTLQELNIPDINLVPSDASKGRPPDLQTSATTKRRKNLAPILVLPPSRARSTSCSPNFPSPQFPRTPTLALDTVHKMAGAFGKPISPVSPATPLQPDQTPFTFMQGFQFTPYTGQTITPTLSHTDEASLSSKQDTSRCSYSFESHSVRDQAEFDTFAGDQSPVSVRDSTEDAAGSRDSPPPAYTLAPHRKSSLDFRQRSRHDGVPEDALVGLGITGHARSGSGLTAFVFPRRHQGHEIASPTTSIDTPLLLNSPPVQQTTRDGKSTHPQDNSMHRMGRQKSMPNLSIDSGRPVAPPPSMPLPAVPHDSFAKYSARRGRSFSPPSNIQVSDLEPHDAGSTTFDSQASERISPLASNPVSPAELKFARRLSVANGFPVAGAPMPMPMPPLPSEVGPRVQKRSISKSPPPSTWETWRAFPTLKSSAPNSRPDSGVFRSVTVPTTLTSSHASKEDPVGTVATSIDEFLMTRHRSVADGATGGRSAAGSTQLWDDEHQDRNADNSHRKTVEVDGFRFPVTL